MVSLPDGEKNFEDMFIRFDVIQKGQRSKVKEIIVLIKARSFLDELNLEHLTS